MFGAAMAEATATLKQPDQNELVRVLESLAAATRELVDERTRSGRALYMSGVVLNVRWNGPRNTPPLYPPRDTRCTWP